MYEIYEPRKMVVIKMNICGNPESYNESGDRVVGVQNTTKGSSE